MLPRKWFLLAAIALLILPFASLSAQSQPTISIALPSIMNNIIDESIFDDFENANGVQVYVKYVDAAVPPASAGMDAYLDGIADYASEADVVYVSGNELTLDATRAGYFLDLSPLTSADGSLNPDDFIPAAWNSVQWDNGVWGLPLDVDATMLIYDPDAFDQAGVAYPNQRWTLDDLANAARALTQYDASGAVSVPGLSTFGSTAALFRSLYGQNFFDDAGSPRFTDPALEDLLTKWQELVDDGIVGSTFTGGSNQVPMRIMGSFGLRFGRGPGGGNQTPSAATTLPGGSVGLSMNALAVSSGTQQPELAYALAKYLTNNPSVAASPLSGSPARQSLVGLQPTQGGGNAGNAGRAGIAVAIGGSSAEAQAALSQLLPSALSLNDQNYSDYVNSALNAMSSDGVDAHTALQQMEAQAAADLQTAADRRASVSVVVATPPPPVVLQPGEIALKFGVQSFVQPIPNLDQWQQLASDFSASDPDVGEVILDTDFGGANELAERDDCFYLGSNAVQNLDSTTIINLDPYLDADPNFNPNDVVGGLMTQLQKDNYTWAYPLTIQPQALNYNATIFQQAGVPAPDGSWTIDQFNDALRTLKTYLDKAPFAPRDLNGESLMMLIAAYGGLPIDYRTNPATFNFTDPATVAAVQQVLDLAKNGYISYQALAGGAGFRIITLSADQQDAITSDALGGFRRFGGNGPGGGGSNDTRLVSYPSGTYTGASYSIGTGYISATAQNPDACYRWLSYIAQHIDVFGAMPARVSQINDPTIQASLGDNATFYSAYAQLLANPNTVVFPAAGNNSAISDFITQFWLNRAFDNYVLNNGDLAADLGDAQTYATAFQDCIASLPPSENSVTGALTQGINSSIRDCAATADPSIGNLFPGG